VTWNIWNGGEGRLAAIERVLREQDADVVAVQEANDRSAVEALGGRLGMDLVYGDANSEFAVAWLSRVPITYSENHRLPVLAKTLLETGAGGIRFYTTHLVHGRTKRDADLRLEEVRAILEVVEFPCVLVGDFNAVHPDDEIGSPPADEQAPTDHVARRPIQLLLEAGFVDCYRALHDDRGWTYATSHPWFRVDFVFATERVEIERCDVVTSAGGASDHFPLVAELR
jgi:exodeoxyribonuclease-3